MAGGGGNSCPRERAGPNDSQSFHLVNFTLTFQGASQEQSKHLGMRGDLMAPGSLEWLLGASLWGLWGRSAIKSRDSASAPGLSPSSATCLCCELGQVTSPV